VKVGSYNRTCIYIYICQEVRSPSQRLGLIDKLSAQSVLDVSRLDKQVYTSVPWVFKHTHLPGGMLMGLDTFI